MNNLIFGQAQTIAQLKVEQGVTTLTISKRENSEKRYFTCGAVRGPVATNFDSSKTTIISECTSPDTGDIFKMLHNRVEINVLETL